MTASQITPEPQERGAWLRTLYQLTHSDTRWAKEQGWRVVNWTLLLFGALLAIAKWLAPDFSLSAFVIANLFLLAVGIYYLVNLHCWALSNRKSAEQLEAQIPEDVASLLDRRGKGAGAFSDRHGEGTRPRLSPRPANYPALCCREVSQIVACHIGGHGGRGGGCGGRNRRHGNDGRYCRRWRRRGRCSLLGIAFVPAFCGGFPHVAGSERTAIRP